MTTLVLHKTIEIFGPFKQGNIIKEARSYVWTKFQRKKQNEERVNGSSIPTLTWGTPSLPGAPINIKNTHPCSIDLI